MANKMALSLRSINCIIAYIISLSRLVQVFSKLAHNSMKEFYKNKKVLITGHTGFKGAWLTQILLNWGAEVVGISLKPNTNPSLFEALEIEKKINNYFGMYSV